MVEQYNLVSRYFYEGLPVNTLVKGERLYIKVYDITSCLQITEARKLVNHLVIEEKQSDLLITNNVLYAPTSFIFTLATKADRSKRNHFLLWLLDVMDDTSKQLASMYNRKPEYKEDLYSVTQIAKKYGMSSVKLNDILHDARIQYKVNGQWVLYEKHQDKGYTRSVMIQVNSHDVMHTYWTKAGVEFIEFTLFLLGYYREQDQLSLFENK